MFNKNSDSDNTDILSTDFDNFKKEFFEINPDINEEDWEYLISYKKGIPYFKFSDINNYILPKSDVLGEFLIRNSKITGHDVLGFVNVLKGKRNKTKTFKYYNSLQATPIGIIPLENNKCVVLCRKNITAFTIIFPIVLIRLILYTYFKI